MLAMLAACNPGNSPEEVSGQHEGLVHSERAGPRVTMAARVLVLSLVLPVSVSALACGQVGRPDGRSIDGQTTCKSSMCIRRAWPLMAADPERAADATESPSGVVESAVDDGIMTPQDTLKFIGTIGVYVVFFFAVAAVLKQFTPAI